MSRVAVVLDPIFKRVGLSGKSVIPFVIAVGCAVPAVMASRTIRDDKERRAAAMLAPFMPCGAKIPVIALFAGAFFDGAGHVDLFNDGTFRGLTINNTVVMEEVLPKGDDDLIPFMTCNQVENLVKY